MLDRISRFTPEGWAWNGHVGYFDVRYGRCVACLTPAYECRVAGRFCCDDCLHSAHDNHQPDLTW